jgi:hypothetical protein
VAVVFPVIAAPENAQVTPPLTPDIVTVNELLVVAAVVIRAK